MYLNALVLDVPLAPKVPWEVRVEAEKLATRAENPRREVRRRELELVGAPERGSIWGGDLRYDTAFVYLRPTRECLDRNIRERSAKIVREGVEEAKRLRGPSLEPNPSVREAVGLKEMLLHAGGCLSSDEAQEAIATRTRKLARRQIRWFDKLVRHLPNTTPFLVAENVADVRISHTMYDIMQA